MVKKLNLIIATLYSVILATVETLLNNYWNDWEYFPLWIVDYFIAIILLSAVFLFKDNYQKIMLMSGWSFSAGVTYMALFISLLLKSFSEHFMKARAFNNCFILKYM